MNTVDNETAAFLQRLAIASAMDYSNGLLTFEQWSEIMAVLSLRAQGVTEPTDEAIKWRIAEMDTATSFLSACAPK